MGFDEGSCAAVLHAGGEATPPEVAATRVHQ